MDEPPRTQYKSTEIQADETRGLSDTHLDALIEASPVAAFVVDADDRFSAVNAHFCAVLGCERSDLIGARLGKAVGAPEPGRGRVRAFDLPHRTDLVLLRSDGVEIHAEVFRRKLAEGGSMFFAIDLTERLRAEDARLESEKKQWQSHRIEALGRLAGGVAHDFNNFLAVLLLHVDILSLNLESDDPIRGRVNEIKDVANSIALTVRQLFAFGRKQPMTPVPADMNAVIENFAGEFRQSAGNFALEIDLAGGLGVCFVDPVQILQVLRNLAEHAGTSMPERGTLKITSANVEIASESSATRQPPGAYVQLTVADNGVGMDRSAAEHVFEPFFAAGGSERGAGMKLATVYGIVKQSKGFVWVESEPGRGTTFTIQFPRIDPTERSETPSPTTIESEADPRKTVLLVDDEPAVRRITSEFLKMSGLEVLEAGNGMEALEIAQAYFEPIHLLLTDLSMPLMDGRRVAEKIGKLHPETAVLFMSGNAEHGVADASNTLNAEDFIGKPFSSKALTEKIADMLKNSPGNAR